MSTEEFNLQDFEEEEEEIELVPSKETKDYPSLRFELHGVTSQEELANLKNISCSSGEDTLPFYIVYGVERFPLNHLKLDLDTILTLRFINKKYRLVIIDNGDSADILSHDSDEAFIQNIINFMKVR